MELCLLGEDRAWRVFVQRYRPLLAQAAMEGVKAEGKAPDEDLVQETISSVFEQLLEDDCRRLRSFRWNCSLHTWLYLIGFRHARHELRKRRRRDRRRLPWSEQVEQEARRVSAPPEVDDLREGLARLAPEDQTLLDRLYSDLKTYREISEETGVPVQTLWARAASARKRLLEILRGFRSFLL